MYLFQGNDINSLYLDIVNKIMKDGQEIEKGGKKIKELYPCLIKIENPKKGILLIEGRPYSPAFLVAETLWNLTGDSDIWIARYNKLYSKYFTGGQLKAGYGNRIFNWDRNTNQFELAANRLREEPHTQHAYITIFNPTYDLKNPKFVPCITNLKFRIRNNKLDMTAFMRAQDMWLGFPYDINLLLTIFQLMANELKIEMGDYYHSCDVLRIYEPNFSAAEKIRLSDSKCNGDIELNQTCDFTKLKFYRDIIRDLPTNTLELISSEPEYWQNGIKACFAYMLLHNRQIPEANTVVNSITNCLKEQFYIWNSNYHDSSMKKNINA